MATSPEQRIPSSELPAGARGPEDGTESPETGLESQEGGQDLESTEEGEPSLAERQEDLAEDRQELAEDQERIQEEVKEIEELREALDVPEGSQQESVSERMLKERQDKLEKRSDALGRELLGAPESEPTRVEDPDELESLEPELEIDLEQSEEEMRQERQRFVDQFVEDSKQKIMKEWQPYFDEAENGERVAGLLKMQIESGVRAAGKDFLENGEGIEKMSFVAHMDRSHYDTGDGGEKTFVTDFKVVMGDNTERTPVDTMSQKQQEELGRAERDPGIQVEEEEGGSGKK